MFPQPLDSRQSVYRCRKHSLIRHIVPVRCHLHDPVEVIDTSEKAGHPMLPKLFKGKGINTDTGNISTGEFEFRFQYTSQITSSYNEMRLKIAGKFSDTVEYL